MRLGIDAANLRAGGGVTHLVELLSASDPRDQGISRITVWSGRRTLDELPSRPWIHPAADPALDRGLLARTAWQARTLPREAARACDVLFVPGGAYRGAFRPFVAMFRNMLPFAPAERRRYGLSRMRLKLALLHRAQRATFRAADGLILLTEYARDVLARDLERSPVRATVIPHGVDRALLRPPRPQAPIAEYSPSRPFRLLYVSTVDLYKHQWQVARAVAALRDEGLPLAIEFVGGAYEPARRRLEAALAAVNARGPFAAYRGPVPRADLAARYHAADGFVFASTCENLPNILVEAMAAGLPIASSDRRPMPDVLGSAGTYFDPESVPSIAAGVRALVVDAAARARCSRAAYDRALTFSWERCARATFEFITSVATRAAQPAAARALEGHV